MRNTFLFLRDIGGNIDGSKLGRAAGAILSVIIFLILLYVLLLPQEKPLQVSSKLENFPEGHRTLAQIEKGLSSTAINDLYLSLRSLDSVENIIYVLSEEVQKGVLNVPPELPKDANYFLIKTSDRNQLRNELKSQTGVPVVTILSNQTRRTSSGSLSLWLKILILVIVSLLAATSFYFIRSFTKELLDSWKGELEIIKYAGVSRLSVKTPLVLIGTLTGFLGSLASVVVLFLISLWSSSGIWLSHYLPGTLESTPLLIIAGWSLVLGIVIGFLSSLSSTREVDKKWTWTPGFNQKTGDKNWIEKLR